jgi:hypothetical protein
MKCQCKGNDNREVYAEKHTDLLKNLRTFSLEFFLVENYLYVSERIVGCVVFVLSILGDDRLIESPMD